MRQETTARLLAIKDVVRVTQAKPNGSGWTGHCPLSGHNHGDKNPSLDIKQGDKFPPGFATYVCRTQGHSYKEITVELRKKIDNGATAQQQEAVQEPTKPEKPGKTAKDFGWPERWQPLSQTTYDILCKSRPESYTPRLETLLQYGFREQVWYGKPQIGYPVLYGGDLALLKICPAALPLSSDGKPMRRPWPQFAPDPSRKVPSDLIYPLDLLTFEDNGILSPLQVLLDADDTLIKKDCTEFYSSGARPCGRGNFLFLVESQWDALALIELGYTAFSFMNAGQESVSKDILHILSAVADHIFLVPQNDGKGHELMRRVLKLLPPEKTAVIELPPDFKDICELLRVQDESQVHATLARIVVEMKAVQQQVPVALAVETAFQDTFANTDSGNAERLLAKHGQNFRWLLDLERFYVWNGAHWEQTNKAGTMLLPATKDVARSIAEPKWAVKSESSDRRNAMIAMVKGEDKVWARHDYFNQHTMLLTVKNGTLDLETQNLREFRREDYLAAQAPVVYDAAAKCEKFDAFMEHTFAGDPDTIAWMDKALGYTLTGDVGESLIFICHGNGENGKTVLLEVIRGILGSCFSWQAKFSTFTERDGGYEQPDYELANMVHARMVTASETSRAATLNESRLKAVTGDGMIGVRQIRGEPFQYQPQFKLWLSTNHEPRIVGQDDGIWRRIIKIPFTQTVPKDRQVPEYHKVLVREEAPGILNRMLRGLRAWREEGLKPPAGNVAKATDKYRASQNTVRQFIAEACTTGNPNLRVACGVFGEAYNAWAAKHGAPTMTLNAISQVLQSTYRHGRYRGDGKDELSWYGIALAGVGYDAE